jgi:hypothetical protein
VRKGDFWESELFAKDALTEIATAITLEDEGPGWGDAHEVCC